MERKVTTGMPGRLEDNTFTEHIEDAYFLVLGFEVNGSPLTNPDFEQDMKDQNKEPSSAYYEMEVGDDYPGGEGEVTIPMHNATSDPGHTFMYLVRNQRATLFLSLGPLVSDMERFEEFRQAQHFPSQAEINKMIENFPATRLGQTIGHQTGRAYGRGTSDYHIPEKSFLFKLKISEQQYNELYRNVEKVKADIETGEKYYNIFDNHTCAKVVRYDAIGRTIPDLPWGRSLETLSTIYAINPYAFYDQMTEYKKKTKYIMEFVIGKDEKDWNNFIVKIRDGYQEKRAAKDMPKDIILIKGVKK